VQRNNKIWTIRYPSRSHASEATSGFDFTASLTTGGKLEAVSVAVAQVSNVGESMSERFAYGKT
jgi:hypothetical protein